MKITTELAIANRQSLIELIEVADQEKKVGGIGDVILDREQADEVLAILEWAVERLETQRRNSKIYLAKTKLVNKLIKEQLSADELAEINRQAAAAADKV